MRRKEREIKDKGDIEGIIHKAVVCRLGVCAGDRPYVVPLCFGYREGKFYFHCSREGMKLEFLKQNPKVCVEIDTAAYMLRSEKPCDWGIEAQSIIAFGKASLVMDAGEKQKALDEIMEHYGAVKPYTYNERVLEKTMILKVEVEEMTGKKLGSSLT